jgi:hypothetical protein
MRTSKIQDALNRAERNGYAIAEREWESNMRLTIEQLERDHAVRLQGKDSEITLLNSVIDSSRARIKDAIQKDGTARVSILKAQEMVTRVYLSFKNHAEAECLIFNDLTNLRDEIERYERRLLEEKK